MFIVPFGSSRSLGVKANVSDTRAPVRVSTEHKVAVGPPTLIAARRNAARSAGTRYLRRPWPSNKENSITLLFFFWSGNSPILRIDLPKSFATKSPILFHQYTKNWCSRRGIEHHGRPLDRTAPYVIASPAARRRHRALEHHAHSLEPFPQVAQKRVAILAK